MDKKNLLGMLFFVGLLGFVVSGIVMLQPDKKILEVETAEYNMSGFPVLPSSN